MLRRTKPFVGEQIVLVDDRTTDRTAESALGCGAVVLSVQVDGPSVECGALQYGHSLVKTPWVWFISDDELPSWSLLRQIDGMTKRRAFHDIPVAYLMRTDDGARLLGETHRRPCIYPADVEVEARVHGGPTGPYPRETHSRAILWHLCNFAPLEERKAKVERYLEGVTNSWDRTCQQRFYLPEIARTPTTSIFAARRL